VEKPSALKCRSPMSLYLHGTFAKGESSTFLLYYHIIDLNSVQRKKGLREFHIFYFFPFSQTFELPASN
jgi:hypothetical protein